MTNMTRPRGFMCRISISRIIDEIAFEIPLPLRICLTSMETAMLAGGRLVLDDRLRENKGDLRSGNIIRNGTLMKKEEIRGYAF
jgi:hypothetical protein